MVVGIDPSEDMAVINQKFVNESEKSSIEAQKWVMAALKDEIQSRPTPGFSPSHMLSSTKRRGLTASPFLKLTVWIERREKLIVKYKEYWRLMILHDYLDGVAKEKFVGYESNYPGPMNHLKKFYADP